MGKLQDVDYLATCIAAATRSQAKVAQDTDAVDHQMVVIDAPPSEDDSPKSFPAKQWRFVKLNCL